MKEETMSPEEVKRIRAKSQLSQESFALLLGLGKKTIQRYECGSSKIIPANAKLLRIIDRHPEVLLYFIADDIRQEHEDRE